MVTRLKRNRDNFKGKMVSIAIEMYEHSRGVTTDLQRDIVRVEQSYSLLSRRRHIGCNFNQLASRTCINLPPNTHMLFFHLRKCADRQNLFIDQILLNLFSPYGQYRINPRFDIGMQKNRTKRNHKGQCSCARKHPPMQLDLPLKFG
jgi:hypothetical protein